MADHDSAADDDNDDDDDDEGDDADCGDSLSSFAGAWLPLLPLPSNTSVFLQ